MMNGKKSLVRFAAILLVTTAAVSAPCQQGPESRPEIVQSVRAERMANHWQAALRALDAYQETWNSRDPATWATSLHFPHVRPSARNFRSTQDAEEYAAGVDFGRTLATGWHRSQWDSRRILHVGEDKVHVAGVYSRYRENGERIWTNQVTYIVTRQDGHWGTQARFGAGMIGLEESEMAENGEAARGAIEAYFEALNSLDPEAWAETMHFPQVRLAGDELRMWDDKEAFLAGREPGRQRTWGGTRLDGMEPVQIASAGVNMALRYSLQNVAGETLSTYEAVFLVTRRDGRWAVQARSTFAP